MPKVGISGASGFIATNLINLLKGSNKVVAFSRKKGFLEGVEFRDYNNGEMDCSGIDVLVHAAASNSEADALKINVIETQNVARSCIKFGVKRIIFLSSYAVYGNRETPAKEGDELRPSSNYGQSKALGEEAVRHLAENSGCRATILRLSSVFGEGNSRGAVNKFEELLRRGEKITSQNGQDKRQYIYAGDVAEFIQKRVVDAQKEKIEIYNVSADSTIATSELVELIGKKMGRTPTFIDEKARPPESFMADNSRAKRNGLKINTSLEGWLENKTEK